jgi:hypothetical protein
MKKLNIPGAVLLVMLVAAPGAWAHKLIKDDGSHLDTANAIFVKDVSVSQVVYHVVPGAGDALWLSFGGQAGQELYAELGIPKIDGLENYRPAFVVLGPGLPAVDVPFDIPAGYGGWIFDTTGTPTPPVYDEKFTGTDSWKYPGQTYTLPATGRYYVVGYVPEGNAGKYWVAVGTKEKFTFKDIWELPDTISYVRCFHEVGPVGGLLWFFSVPIRLIRLILGI